MPRHRSSRCQEEPAGERDKTGHFPGVGRGVTHGMRWFSLGFMSTKSEPGLGGAARGAFVHVRGFALELHGAMKPARQGV